MNKRARRIIAAEKLERWAWIVVRYAQRVKRAAENPSPEHEKSVQETKERAKAGWKEFAKARSEYMKP